MKAAKISWGPIVCECDTCICHTEVAFRQEGSSYWYIPQTFTNPTKELFYTILINEGVYYQVRLTFIGPRCNEKITYLTLYFPLSGCCPTGYTMAPDATYCYKIEDVSAIPPSGSVQTLVAATASAYSTCGSWIYNAGYNLDGTGMATQISLGNTFWKNGAGACADATTTDGPLNRTGVWVSPALAGQDIGFGVCLDIPATKTYYIGIAADNYAIIKLDNVILVQQDPTTLGTQYSQGPAATFKVWHIYPITLSAGPHILELKGHNVLSVAAIGCEVYNATAAELMAATSYVDLGSKLIFSSKDQIGQPAQLGTGDAAYTCPAGYSLAPCETPIKCRRILTNATITC